MEEEAAEAAATDDEAAAAATAALSPSCRAISAATIPRSLRANPLTNPATMTAKG
jgi:hypothetical protein